MTAGEASHWFDAGIRYLDRGQAEKAEGAFRQALSIDAAHAKANVNLGMLLQRTGKHGEAEQCYRNALRADAGLAQAWFNLGTLALDLGGLVEAAESFQRAIALEATRAMWHSALGWTLRQAGDAEAALEAFRRARDLEPESQVFASDCLHAMHFVRGESAQRIFAAHEAWGRERPRGPAVPAAYGKPDAGKKLRIGYLAPDFNDPALACLVEPVLASHARTGFDVLCYSDADSESAGSWRLRKLADLWHATARMNNDQLADRMREDGVDILVDLAGHGARGKRMRLFEQRPAPVQVSWLGCPGTTGSRALDYRLLDARACPPGEEHLFTERVVRLPDCTWCFAPEPGLRAAIPAPRPQGTTPTFGSIRDFSALSRPTVALWARVLLALPGSRLLIAARGALQLEKSVKERFGAQGVDPGRIELRDIDPRDAASLLHGDIDICLDAVPCAGIATTFESLWMGVPVVVLEGGTAAARSGAGICAALGMHELIARNDDEYVAVAVALARNPQRLSALRRELRPLLQRSCLTDARRFTSALENSYRAMWQSHCAAYVPATVPGRDAPPARRPDRRPRIVVDGVFFQTYETGIARVWRTLLREWQASGFAGNVVLLDREHTAPAVPGVRVRQVPRHSYDRLDEDRAMLQAVCDEERASVFISTYYTTPLATPVVMMVHDMIPELLDPGSRDPAWREKSDCVSRASHYIAVSRCTARDLLRIHPEVPAASVTVAHNGVDALFRPAGAAEVDDFRRRHGLVAPYFLLVGSRPRYKNAELFFRAFARLPERFRNYGVLCVGNAPQIDPGLAASLPASAIKVLRLTDDDLRLAYCGAVALVYPSIYEGFGMPVIEALACGCPVIATSHSSLPEVAGDAAIYVHPTDEAGLAAALEQVQDSALRATLRSRGLARTALFSWSEMARSVAEVLGRYA